MTNTSIQQILQSYPDKKRDALIPILQDVQEKEGFLSKESVTIIGDYLNLPASKIYGVATFYNQFRFQPLGRYHIQLCRGTACHVKGSLKLLHLVTSLLGIEPGQTSKDRLFSLETVACLGACGLSPVICVNGEFYAKVSPKQVKEIIENLRNKG